ncbi:hypothetical protein BB8028_0007g05640 [Beauveria bassiana]|uniref:Uncharacterized protein n=1 Tax=Beauveria bassiana TaxID=176275 RepID=A0A2S7YN34_BEABA|nr:hypothetical protein BB8028_0007g05640 [Beauveria bassiana]
MVGIWLKSLPVMSFCGSPLRSSCRGRFGPKSPLPGLARVQRRLDQTQSPLQPRMSCRLHHQHDISSFNEDAAHNTQRPARRAFYLATRYAMAVHFFIYYVLLLMDARLPCSWMRGFPAHGCAASLLMDARLPCSPRRSGSCSICVDMSTAWSAPMRLCRWCWATLWWASCSRVMMATILMHSGQGHSRSVASILR